MTTSTQPAPQTDAVVAYQEARAALAEIGKAARAAERIAQQLQMVADGAGLAQPHLDALQAAWRDARAMLNHMQKQDATLSAADIALAAVQEQRVAAANEYNSLIQALKELDYEHPQLVTFVEQIEEGAYEMMAYNYGEQEIAIYTFGKEMGLEVDTEQLLHYISGQMFEAQGSEAIRTLNAAYALLVGEMNETLTPEQTALLERVADEMFGVGRNSFNDGEDAE